MERGQEIPHPVAAYLMSHGGSQVGHLGHFCQWSFLPKMTTLRALCESK
jgi:hypothetical protein